MRQKRVTSGIDPNAPQLCDESGNVRFNQHVHFRKLRGH